MLLDLSFKQFSAYLNRLADWTLAYLIAYEMSSKVGHF